MNKRSVKNFILLLVIIVNSSVFGLAYSKQYPYTSDEGHEYFPTITKTGITLTSTTKVSRFIGYGASTDIVKQIEVIQLKKNCSAYNNLFGVGYWGWANGGFWVKFPKSKKSFMFGRQEINFNERALGWSIDKCMYNDPDDANY